MSSFGKVYAETRIGTVKQYASANYENQTTEGTVKVCMVQLQKTTVVMHCLLET